MEAIAGFVILLCIIALLLTKKVSVHLALIVPPVIGALALGFSLVDISGFAAAGLTKIASTGIMLTFAVLFFGILFDAGMFDPLITKVIKLAGGDPVKIALGTAVIATVVHLDGSGSVTFLITCSAMLPVYKAMKMNPIVLAVCAGMAAGVMNLLPWGGPTIRAASALQMDVTELFVPMIPWVIIGLISVYLIAILLGRVERRRIGISRDFVYEHQGSADPSVQALKRPKMMIPNVILCVGSIVILLTGKIPLVIVFLAATPIALVINYPDPKEQQKRIQALSPTALYTATIIFCAGVFTGILANTGMITAMANAIGELIPASLGKFMPTALGLISPIALLFIDPDSFYYGLLPILSATAQGMGAAPAAIAHAMLIGQHIFCVMPLTGASWLLCSLCEIDMGDLQKKVIPISMAIAVLFVISGLIFGII